MWIKRTCLDEVPPRHPTDSLNSLGEALNLFTVHLKTSILFNVHTTAFALKRLAHADLAKKHTIFGMTFYCFKYDFSAALISALALLKYASLSLTVVPLMPRPINQKRNIRNLFPFTCPATVLPVSYRRHLTLCTALSTSPPGHPGLPAETCMSVTTLLVSCQSS